MGNVSDDEPRLRMWRDEHGEVHVRVLVDAPLAALTLYGGKLHIGMGSFCEVPLMPEEWAMLEMEGVSVPDPGERMFPFHGPREFCSLREDHGRYVRLDVLGWVCSQCRRPARATPDNVEGRLKAGHTAGGGKVYHAENGRGRAFCRAANGPLRGVRYAVEVPAEQRCKLHLCQRAFEQDEYERINAIWRPEP